MEKSAANMENKNSFTYTCSAASQSLPYCCVYNT